MEVEVRARGEAAIADCSELLSRARRQREKLERYMQVVGEFLAGRGWGGLRLSALQLPEEHE